VSKSVNGREPSVDTRDTSSFAVAVRALDPRVLPALGVMDAALVFIEIAVVVSKAACAADDGRPGGSESVPCSRSAFRDSIRRN
jgi:hypothetical protein